MYSRRLTKIYAVAATVFCFSLAVHTGAAQTVKTFIDKQDILIGEQIKYKVVATAPSGVFKVQWMNIPDSLPHFELVDKTKIDTTTKDGNTVLEQTLTLTSFDSGRWQTPSFVVNFDPVKDDTTINIATDSFAINVGYAPSDSTNELRDIKPILDVTIKNYFWYYAGGAILLVLLAAFCLWRYFKSRAKKPKGDVKGRLPAYEEAMQELAKLQQLNLQLPEDSKQFHTKLAGIFKWYISRIQRKSILNKTTDDVLVHLTGNSLPPDTMAATAAALRTGDAVKFAKYLPVPQESMDALEKIKSVIGFVHAAGRAPRATNNNQQSTINNQ